MKDNQDEIHPLNDVSMNFDPLSASVTLPMSERSGTSQRCLSTKKFKQFKLICLS